MSRDEILAETIARLEAERYAPSPRPVEELLHPTPTPGPAGGYHPVTAAEAAHNRAVLAAAVGDDTTLIAWRESA
jgi:hypothetical protein